jgi:hypothetical protein
MLYRLYVDYLSEFTYLFVELTRSNKESGKRKKNQQLKISNVTQNLIQI